MYREKIEAGGSSYQYYSINKYAENENLDISRLPFTLKILLENLLRNASSEAVNAEDIKALASWKPGEKKQKDIAYFPARVIMQDFTGVPAVVDLAAMRSAISKEGGNVKKINPLVPVDLVIDHSVMVDYYGSADAFNKNAQLEFKRNRERYRFLKWGQKAFDNFRVIPPDTGIIHQINLEYLAKVVWIKEENGIKTAYPDTVVGTDSHTTMINGLGVLGWGVGGIEAEAAMLGQSITMLIPEVVGFELKGKPAAGCTATDIVLTVVKMLREKGVVGKFVEFFGEGLSSLSLADRATLSNMAPEYGATCGYFPVDSELLSYLDLTGRSREQIELVEKYAKAQGLWRESGIQSDYSDTLTLDLSTVVPALAGPRRPQDLVELTKVPQNFRESLKTVYNVKNQNAEAALEGIKGAENKKLTHGDIAIASISSCTNTSNPAVLVAAALLAKKALEKGIKTKPWVKTSFTPGSQVVAEYLKEAGLLEALEDQGFSIAGFGCATCIGNSGPLPEPVKNAIYKENLVTVNVLSGNRNFEGRVSPDSKASYLASPPLVVAYALSGSILTDWENEPVGTDKNGSNVYLKDIWPSAEEINNISADFVRKDLFSKAYSNVFEGSENWQKLDAPESEIYDWEEKSTYIRRPPFFDNFMQIKPPQEISSAAILAIMPDSTTTDHISPAGTIPPESPAGKYLKENGVEPEDFNSYGSRRGNHEVMMRGTFANIRIKNRMIPGTEGGYTLDPEGNIVPIFDAAEAWKKKGRSTVVIAGKEYGTGSSRDWAAKGPMLQGVKAVIAESFERIHRSNLIGMGILPFEFTGSDSAVALELTGKEEITIKNLNDMQPGSAVSALIKYSNGAEKEIKLLCRIDTPVEMEYWRSGGILNFVLKNMVNE